METAILNTLNVLPSIGITITVIFTVAIFIRYRFNVTSKSARESMDNFVDEEIDANLSRVQPIDKDFFRKPNIESLPIKDNEYLVANYDEVKRYLIFANQRKLLECVPIKMIRSDKKLTNVEIKKRFGAKNLDSFSIYEQNLTNYTNALRELASVYINLKEYDNAKAFLDECMRVGSQSSITYTLLAKYYYEQNDRQELLAIKKLCEKEDFLSSNEIGKEKLKTYLKTLK